MKLERKIIELTPMAMAIKTKQLISSMLLIVSVWKRLHLSEADQHNYTAPIWGDCGNSGTHEFTNASAFQDNRNRVLESLVANVNPSGFNTFSVVVDGKNHNDSVYGLLQCRGDLAGSSECKLCASTAKTNLLQTCYNTSGFIQLNACFLRYDYYNFYNGSDSSEDQNVIICNTENTTDQPEQFTNAAKARLSDVINKSAQSPKLFSADLVEEASSPSWHIYSIAQCWRDLSPESCQLCLADGLHGIFGQFCKTRALGAQFLSLNCYLRYEIYDFFNTSKLSLPAAAGENPRVPSEGEKPKVLRTTPGIIATTAGLFTAIALCMRKFFSRKCLQQNITRDPEIGEDSGEIHLSRTIGNPGLIFKYDILRDATSNFKAEHKLGEGGFGSVFKGYLPDGREVAVKRLNIRSSEGDAEFLNEANLISRVQHKNLVKLLGCSVESSERLLVYEYLQNSLDKILFDTTKSHLLDWKKRYEIILGIAHGLAYLHEESEIRIIHRDIKASNILLDNKYRAKIADFGLAKLFREDQSHVSTRVAGTLGYMAPEYALRGHLTEKADVFSFGVLILEIISGRKNQSLADDQDMEFLIERTWRLYKGADRVLDVMDPTLRGSYSWEEGIRVIKIGLLCTQAAAVLRPSMSRVVWMLTSEREHLPSPARPAFIDLDGGGAPGQVERPRVIVPPDKTSTNSWSSEAATSSKTPSDILSAAADPSSGLLEPR